MNVDKLKIKLKNIFSKTYSRSIEYRNGINYSQAKNIMMSEKCILLDVRSMQEYEEFHLPRAICIPVYDLNKDAYKVLNDVNETIIVYCQCGKRSKSAIRILKDLGYNNVYEIIGGLDAI